MHWKPQELDTNTPRLNFLVAYPYCKPDVFEVLKNQTLPYRFLLDSGAFTAHNAGKVITLDDYCRFIEAMPIKPWRYFQLDVVGDPDKTARNYEKMIERGFTPVPVFTHNESLSRLDELYETSDVVALGGLVGNKNRKSIVRRVMNHAKGRKVHLLGFTNEQYVKFYKPYMCDSSSLLSAQRYGTLSIYCGRGKMTSLQKSDFLSRPKREILEILTRWGFDPKALAKKENWTDSASMTKPSLHQEVSYYSWVLKSLDYEKNLKTKLFLSVSNQQQVMVLFRNFQRILGR